MYSDHLRAQILRNPRQFRGVEAGMIPPHAHLDGNRHIDGLHGRLNQRSGQRQVAHQSATRVAVYNFLDRTAHIDVDDRRATIGIQLRRFGHFLR